MMSLLKAAAVTSLGLIAVCSSQADTLNLNTLTSMGTSEWTPDNSFYYKFEAASGGGVVEEGAGTQFLQGSFTDGGLTAIVSWNPAVFTPDFEFITIKSSTKIVTWDVQLIDWSQYDSFRVTNTEITNANAKFKVVPQQISHVSIDGSVHSVPDAGATVVLLGMGLMVVGLFRRLAVRS